MKPGATRPPARWLLGSLIALAFGSPFAARAAGTMWGSFGMFQRVERYHLALAVHTPRGDEPVPLASLARHLSRDARRILLPASGQAYGTDQIELVEEGLEDLAELVCELRPDATSVELRWSRSTARLEQARVRTLGVPCGAR
jgi:hypothetical protein